MNLEPIIVTVNENDFAYTNKTVVSDSVEWQRVKFAIPVTWAGYRLTAVFENRETTVNVLLNTGEFPNTDTNECYIPHEVIKAKAFTVLIFGTKDDSVCTASKAVIRVVQSGMKDGKTPLPPTPGAYQQILETAEEAKEIAQSVKEKAATKEYVDNLIGDIEAALILLRGGNAS